MEAEARSRLHSAMAVHETLAPTAAGTDVYVREALAICVLGAARGDVVRQVLRRMALPLEQDDTDLAVFTITQSTRYSNLQVYFKDERVVSYKLGQQDGERQE